MEILARVNLIDIFCLILYLRITYIAVSRGVLLESFKLVGLLAGIILAFQYYSPWADKLNNKVPFIKPENVYFLSFLTILLSLIIFFVLLRTVSSLVFRGYKKDKVSATEKFIGFFVGLARASFLSSAVIFLVYLTPFVSSNFSQAVSYKVLKNLSPQVYLGLINLRNRVIPGNIISNDKVTSYYKIH